MHAYACLFAYVLGREVYKEKKNNKKKTFKKNPTFEWEIVFAQRCQKIKQYFAVREMLPSKM